MPTPISRREFASLAAAATALSAAANLPAADDKPGSPKPPSPVDLLVDLVRQKYPHERLDEAAIDEIRSDFQHFLARSRVLSSFPLQNGDEPGFMFSAWRADLTLK